MAGAASEESGMGRFVAGISSGQQCQSGEALAQRSSEQVENGTPPTSPPYWNSDDEDDSGPKPSDLYGKYTWKIEKFSEINERALRSNAFEVGGCKWYILVYPQGCDVNNYLSLFLCVADRNKLRPGWTRFAQFTLAVKNKDPKKSKYSDTLHRFWKKEHDWGWKKFMELSKVFDGHVESDTLIIKAQVQVIRVRADRPFRCLDYQYRRELVRVYLGNIEQIFQRFLDEKQGKLRSLIDDKGRRSSFYDFLLGLDQNARRRMSQAKTDVILRLVVKHFFVEKEVISTLVMDSLYIGLKAIEGQSTGKKAKSKLFDAEEMPASLVRVENDKFILVDDVLQLMERGALEPLPPKEEKGPQNRAKDGNSREDSIEPDERWRLTELGRRTVEIFVLEYFINKLEFAYREAVALKRQEELIREEAAWLAEREQKAKPGASKRKKSKKKQVYDAKQKGPKHDDSEVNLGGNNDEEELLLQGNCHATEANVDCNNHLQITQQRLVDDASVVSQYDQQETLEAHQSNYPVDLKDINLAWFFVVTNFILEIPLLVFDQLGSAKHLYYAFFVMLISAMTLMICIVELIWEGKRGRYRWKWEGPRRTAIPWFYCPETNKPLGTVWEFIGLASAVPQFIIIVINYSYIYRHRDGPINISILRLIFAFGLLCSKFFERSKHLRERICNAQNEGNIRALDEITVQ